MPKLRLEFDLPEEASDADYARKGQDLYFAIFRARERILKDLKHSDISNEMERGYEACLGILNETLEEHDLENLFK